MGGWWEYELLVKYLLPYIVKSRFILDIGAHIGSHTVFYGHVNPAAQILAFEPQKAIHTLLQKNTARYPNVLALNTCLGHEDKLVTMSQKCEGKDITYGSSQTINLGGMALGQHGEVTQMIRIDSLNLPRCDFIKIDVEGAEGLVFMGAKDTLFKFKPVICFEYSHQLDTTPIKNLFSLDKVPDAKELLSEIGYTKFTFLEGDNWLAEWS
jgi:FkbM family methyltransferase